MSPVRPHRTLRRASLAALLATGALLVPVGAASAAAGSTTAVGPLVQGPLIQGPLVDLGSDGAAACPDGSAPQTQQGLLQRQQSCGAAEQQQSPLLGQQQQPAGS